MKLSRTAVSFLCAALCAPAFAGLGGTVASVDADRVSLKGEVRVTSQAGYTVHAISSASGMVLQEYFAPNGVIFAVSWRGPGVPDLKQMLGSYYEQARQAASGPHYNHHHFTVATPEVVVQSSGHLRSFVGRAWAPALLPQNFSINDIK
jgi:hypothetical protein